MIERERGTKTVVWNRKKGVHNNVKGGAYGVPRVQMLFSRVKRTLLDAHSSVPAL